MMMLGIGLGKDGLRYNLDPVAFETLGWDESRFSELFEKMEMAIEQAESFIGITGNE
jgi:hypothetical protein